MDCEWLGRVDYAEMLVGTHKELVSRWRSQKFAAFEDLGANMWARNGAPWSIKSFVLNISLRAT